MGIFDDINSKLGLKPMTPVDMNKIHIESGEHSDFVKPAVNPTANPTAVPSMSRNVKGKA